jgi:hypothetical protein
MANTFTTTQLFAKGGLMDYAANLRTTMLAKPYRKFDDNAGLGTSIQEAYPYRLSGVNSLTYSSGDVSSVQDFYQTITLNLASTVAFGLTAQEMTFASKASTVEEFRDYYIVQAGKTLANNINAQVIAQCYNYWTDVIGDPTAALNGVSTLSDVNSKLSTMELMNGEPLYVGLHPDSYNALQIPYAQYYNEQINYPILKNGRVANLQGLNIYDDNLISKHTNGTFATSGSIQVNASVTSATLNSTSSTIVLKGFTASQTGVLKAGDYIYFGTTGNFVESVLPQSPSVGTGKPKTFMVMADANSNGSGLATVTVNPVYSDSANNYRNVSRQILINDTVTLFGGASTTWTKNLVFNRGGFFFANPPVATYPLQPGTRGQKYSGLPNETVETMVVPNTGGVRLSINMGSLGSLQGFSNEFALRTLCGALPFANYGFVLAAKA